MHPQEEFECVIATAGAGEGLLPPIEVRDRVRPLDRNPRLTRRGEVIGVIDVVP